VAGRVVYVHSQLHAGGLIRANERIAQIDPSGYDLAVQRARAVMDEAQAKLDLELVAAGMRRQAGQPFDAEGQVALPAVLHEPLVRQAAAALELAKAELATAELQLSRTSVVLPYDVLIVGEPVSLGQYVQAGRSLADACGTETFEVEASIRSEDLCRLGRLEGVGFAGPAPQGPRPAAEIKAVFAGREHTWAGEVVRTTGRVSSESGMISVVVEVPQPLEGSAERPPLLPGMAVEVFIGGEKAGAVIGIGDTGRL
jgi:multidrug efflux pump subunit AcrA (membrane-fusion protein)